MSSGPYRRWPALSPLPPGRTVHSSVRWGRRTLPLRVVAMMAGTDPEQLLAWLEHVGDDGGELRGLPCRWRW